MARPVTVAFLFSLPSCVPAVVVLLEGHLPAVSVFLRNSALGRILALSVVASGCFIAPITVLVGLGYGTIATRKGWVSWRGPFILSTRYGPSMWALIFLSILATYHFLRALGGAMLF